jgi:integrase
MPKNAPAKRMRFTEATIARLKVPSENSYTVWDLACPTLGIRVSKRGLFTWVRENRRLGHWPAMSLKEARARMAGDAPEAPTTFRVLVERFLEHGRTRRGRPLRANTLGQYRRLLLNGHVKELHPKRVREIRRADIARLTRKVASRNGATMASLVRAVLSRLFAFAIETGEVDFSPVTGSVGYAVGKRTRVLSDVELAQLWAATADRSSYSTIIRVLLWTGCRRGEAGGLAWSELDGDLWRIPPERTKNGRGLVLPLPRQAQDALARYPRIVGQDRLFGPKGFLLWSQAKKDLDAELNFAERWVVHSLRATVESRLGGLGVTKEIRSRILNHDVGEIDASYQHYTFDAEKRAALQLWADELARIVAQPLPAVVALKS